MREEYVKGEDVEKGSFKMTLAQEPLETFEALSIGLDMPHVRISGPESCKFLS